MMIKNTAYLVLFLVLATLAACKTKKSVSTTTTPNTKTVAITSHIAELYGLMQGTFDSSAQSDTDESYYDITLHMYPIWQQSGEGKWLYVEQSVTANQTKPYRQRVYKLVERPDGYIASYVYSIKDDSLYIGKWQETSYFDDKTTDILDIREGCEVVMKRIGDRQYQGSTVDKNCTSSLRGASYATSVVEVTPGMISSWDQGWDESDTQVWGAVDGPYVFKKLVALEKQD